VKRLSPRDCFCRWRALSQRKTADQKKSHEDQGAAGPEAGTRHFTLHETDGERLSAAEAENTPPENIKKPVAVPKSTRKGGSQTTESPKPDIFPARVDELDVG